MEYFFLGVFILFQKGICDGKSMGKEMGKK
jgi:hypothetical protein